MAQMTLRVPQELQERVRLSAQRQGASINEFANRVLDAATNPDLAGSAAERLRARFAAAGLMEIRQVTKRVRPAEAEVAAARRAAGRRVPLSQLVSEGRG